jgi:hypothetical protein
MTHPVSQLQHQKEQLQEDIPSDRQFRFTLLQNKDCYYYFMQSHGSFVAQLEKFLVVVVIDVVLAVVAWQVLYEN